MDNVFFTKQHNIVKLLSILYLPKSLIDVRKVTGEKRFALGYSSEKVMEII